MRRKARLVGGLAAPALLAVGSEFPAGPGPVTLPAVDVAPVVAQPAPAWVSQPLDLQTCRKIALEHQPAVAAARASLAAAIARAQAVDYLHLPSFLARDLPIRRKQAALGVASAEAGVTRAEADTLFGVTWSYVALLYADQQLKVADGALKRLKDLKDLAQEGLKKERRDVFEEHLRYIESYTEVTQGRRAEAEQGRQRALAALREAMGLGPDCPLEVPARDWPSPQVVPDRGQIVALALARRGELIQTATAAQAACLEIDAQGTTCRPTLRTFASGSDLHAQVLPPGAFGVDYKPGALAPEMPTTLAGSRSARVEQARDYHARAEAVAGKTRNLIALEAEDAWLRWRASATKAERFKAATTKARVFREQLARKFDPQRSGGYPNLDDIMNAGVVMTQMEVELNEALFQSLAALAALERVTAGGFCADFDAPVPANTNNQ
jgi:outer membrane protein TolC